MKLEFIDGQENLVIKENADKRETSLFKVQYALADKILESISGDSVEHKERRDYNNIIAFCGDRGTGKTSCMMSFRSQLQDTTGYFSEKYAEADGLHFLGTAYKKMLSFLQKSIQVE